MPLRSINRVPFIWSDPASRSANVSSALASTIDLAPTILERAGIKGYNGIQGKSLLGCMDGSSAHRENLLIEHQDAFKRYDLSRFAMIRTLITSRWRFSVWRGESWGELYDMTEDPHETHNLWNDAAYGEIRKELGETLTQQLLENVDQSPHAKKRA